jgi:dihydropteroate synthase
MANINLQSVIHPKPFTLNLRGELVTFQHPQVMGIVNLTPDSFFAESRVQSQQQVIEIVGKMIEEGACFIDLGAVSTRPGSSEVSEMEEADRLMSNLVALYKTFPKTHFSVDTFRSKIAQLAVDAGASIVNDISGGTLDPMLMKTVADLKVPYVIMHMRGSPQNMQENCDYAHLLNEVIYELSEKLANARYLGIADVLIDPGFGFAKNTQQNFSLLKHLSELLLLDCPLLVGVSRKSMIYKTLNTSPKKALNGTSALHMLALQNGASVLRVHDVCEANECIQLFMNYLNAE